METAYAPDPKLFEERARNAWDQAARGWNDHTPRIRAWLRDATQAMLDLAGIRRGSVVLDVAAGAGDQTLDIASRIGAEGRVLATDFSPAIVQLARLNARQAGCTNVVMEVADAGHLPVEDASFDAAVCRLGLMLFADPLQSLREMCRALKPGGHACTLVFSRPEANPCITLLLGTALEHAGLGRRDPYQPGGLLSLGKPGHVDELFRAAGFRDVATTRIDAPFRLPSAAHYLAFVRASASPIQQILCGARPGGGRRRVGRHGATPATVQHERWLGGSERAAADGRQALIRGRASSRPERGRDARGRRKHHHVRPRGSDPDRACPVTRCP